MSTSASTTHVTYPLTTVFTPPAWCGNMPFTYFTSEGGLSTYWRDEYGVGGGSRSSCYPPDFSYQHEATVSGEYSPGVCPTGYVAVSSVTAGGGVETSYCCRSYVVPFLDLLQAWSTDMYFCVAVALPLSKARAVAAFRLSRPQQL